MEFAKRMNNMKASEIRELLKLTQNPEIISFAGGLPAPELFPVKEIEKIAAELIAKNGRQILQYSTTEGHAPLRAKIADRMNKKFKTNVQADNILITSGSQQGLDFSGKIFLNEGDVVLCESPSYMGAINAFNAYMPNFVEVPTDEDGMVMEELERIVATTKNVKMIYVIPDFQNPTGRTWPLARRKKFMEIITKYEIPVIEDDPYGELRYEGETLPCLLSMDTKGLVAFMGTFSKTFCPGLRIGWVAAAPELLEPYITVKQSADLHTAPFNQQIIDAFIDQYDFDAHVEEIKALYRNRRDLIIKTMTECFPSCVTFTHPQGGLFLWVMLPKEINARDLMATCLKKKVAFVPGGPFFPNGGNENTLRLNYSNMPEDKIVEGIKRLGQALDDALVCKCK